MMKLLRSSGLAVVLAACCVGAASAALHPGDKVNILVYNHPELTTQATVDARGDVSMDLIGAVSAQGADEKVLASRIAGRLATYINYPAVNVVLLSQDPTIDVQDGPVGAITYSPGETLISAMDDVQKQCACLLATTSANLQSVKIVRDGKALGPYNLTALEAQAGMAPALEPGDTIAFENKPIAIAVSGAVKTPGTAYLSPSEPLSDAITQLGGYNTSAAYGMIILNRDGQKVQIGQGSPEFDQPARPGDTLEIPTVEHIQVIGAVNAPGDIQLKQDFTLLSAVYYAGGPNKWADLRKIIVLHRGTKMTYNMTQLVHGNLAHNPALEDGDVVYVPEGHKIDWRGFFQDLTWGRFLLPNGKF